MVEIVNSSLDGGDGHGKNIEGVKQVKEELNEKFGENELKKDRDATIDGGNHKEDGSDVQTDEKSDQDDLSDEDVDGISDEILNNPNSLKQLDQLRILKNKHDTGALDSHQNYIYEKIMANARKELDESVPSIIERNESLAVKMNEFIDKGVNYYYSHKDEAAQEAERSVNYNSMDDVRLVGNVIANSEYLGKNSKKKLYSVINKVMKDLDEESKAILENVEK